MEDHWSVIWTAGQCGGPWSRPLILASLPAGDAPLPQMAYYVAISCEIYNYFSCMGGACFNKKRGYHRQFD